MDMSHPKSWGHDDIYLDPALISKPTFQNKENSLTIIKMKQDKTSRTKFGHKYK